MNFNKQSWYSTDQILSWRPTLTKFYCIKDIDHRSSFLIFIVCPLKDQKSLFNMIIVIN